MSWRKSTDPDDAAAQLRALIQLRMLPALTDQRLKQLLSRHNPKSIVEGASLEALSEKALSELRSVRIREWTDRAMRAIARYDVQVLTIFDDDYPQQLLSLDDLAPPILFCRGRLELLTTNALAIIGARDSTEYGDSVAELFATELARRGVTIVSGLARGIDAVAHSSALNAGGATIAVLGCGIDVSYPRQNERLQERIAQEGLLLSEFPPGLPPKPHNFPKRNRIIATLGRGVLVVEAGSKSGTRTTVDWALNHNVDVFAVPGPIGRNESQGTNEIIQDGGVLVVSPRDILDDMHWSREITDNEVVEDLGGEIRDADARAVFDTMEATALHVDVIARRCGRTLIDTLAVLTRLELDGYVIQVPGKRFARVLVRQ